jgi:23S rRNA (adenine2503-C2)-methyltransferase
VPQIPFALRDDPVGAYPNEWVAAFAEIHERPFRAKQVFRWIHTRSVADPARMTDAAKTLRDKLASWSIAMPAEIREVRRAADDTRKVLIGFPKSPAAGTVETVLIPPLPDEEDEDVELEADDDAPVITGLRVAARRVTQCISTQVGCAMGCVFCASGVAGLKRHLSAGEIVAQVLLGRTLLDEGEAIRNVVLMGMGEPLHNYENVARALRLLTHPDGMNLSSRRVTVSTSGLVPEIDRLGEEFKGEIALAVSLHAPDDELRSRIMPVNKKYPLGELMAALRRYPLARRRRITIEYTLIRNVNDRPEHARALLRLLRNLPMKVNLIPMNPIEAAQWQAPTRDDVLAFQDVLRKGTDQAVFIRRTRGDEIDAACGQLALHGAKPVKRKLPMIGERHGGA